MVSSLSVDLKETILGLVEPGDIIELRCLDKSPVGIITPAMILTAQHGGCARLFSGDGVRTVTTDIVECANLVVFSPDQEEREAGRVKGLVGTWLAELGAVGEIYP